MRRRLAAFASIILVLLSGGAEARTLSLPHAFTPVVVRFLGDHTAPVKGSDGRWHIVYELWVTNARPVPRFLAYDQPVLAVANATVVEVLDEFGDQVPGTLPDLATITIANVDGNHIILDLGNGLHVFYAHLKRGTVRVRKGDRVNLGQPLARLGNSGNTSAPHLHMQVMTLPVGTGRRRRAVRLQVLHARRRHGRGALVR